MVSIVELRRIARGRLRDADVLLEAGRYDGAIYLCGYAIETALKARICRTLKWPGYPDTRREFEGFQSFRTHDFAALLRLSGIENKIKANHFTAWNTVLKWDPNVRYSAIGSTSSQEAAEMIQSTKALLGAL
jgi:HEPN domain-containing protein